MRQDFDHLHELIDHQRYIYIRWEGLHVVPPFEVRTYCNAIRYMIFDRIILRAMG